jgi:hypothetical protein
MITSILLRPLRYYNLPLTDGEITEKTLEAAGICGVRVLSTIDMWLTLRPVGDNSIPGPTNSMLVKANTPEGFRTLVGDEIVARPALPSTDGFLYVTEMG